MQDVLDLKMYHGSDEYTIRTFLKALLETLWIEQDQFSAKRPLGDSDWQHGVDYALVQANFIDGTIDEDGELVESNWRESDTIIQNCINYLFEGEPK